MRGKLLLFAAVLVVLGGIFCSCRSDGKVSAQQAAEKVRTATQAFETTARVSYKGLEAVMHIDRSGPAHSAVVTFENPDSLKDLRLTVSEEKTTMEYMGLSVDVDANSMPAKAVSSLVLEAFNEAMNPQGITARKDGGRLVIQGAIDEGEFELVLDGQNGNVLKMTMPQNDLEIEILNFNIFA